MLFVETCFEQKSFALCENGCDKEQEMRWGCLSCSFERILVWQTKCKNLAKTNTYQTVILGDFFGKSYALHAKPKKFHWEHGAIVNICHCINAVEGMQISWDPFHHFIIHLINNFIGSSKKNSSLEVLWITNVRLEIIKHLLYHFIFQWFAHTWRDFN